MINLKEVILTVLQHNKIVRISLLDQTHHQGYSLDNVTDAVEDNYLGGCRSQLNRECSLQTLHSKNTTNQMILLPCVLPLCVLVK